MIHAKSNASATEVDLIHLRILETTDLHGHIMPFDYFKNRPTPALGLARAAGLIGTLRAEVANCLLFDNGDFLQGSPLGDYAAYGGGPAGDDPHPMIAAMNRLDYDAGTLGNHEFNYGLDFLRAALSQAAFPVVAANAVLAQEGEPFADRTLLPPWTLLTRTLRDGAGGLHPIRIGVLGLLPPQTGLWDRDLLQGRLRFHDMVQTAAIVVPAIRAAGADLVVALAHTGIGEDEALPGMENAALPLARIDGIDVLLLGHEHQVFPSAGFAGLAGVDAERGLIAGKPAVMAGCFGSHVGVVDLALRRGPRGWCVVQARTQARPIARTRANGTFVARTQSRPEVLQTVEAAHAATRRFMARPVGATRVPLSTHLALVEDCAALRVVAEAKADHLRRALAGGAHAHLPVLGTAAPGKAGGRGGAINFTDIPAGALALRHMADLYPFPNHLRGLRVTGAEVAEWIERAAAIYHRILPGLPDQPLFDPAFPPYNFDIVKGVSFRIDVGSASRYDARGHLLDPGARRLRELTRNGRPVAPDEEFVLATNSYRLATLSALTLPAPPRLVHAAARTGREVLTDWFVAGNEPDDRPAAEGWSLLWPRGASVTFDTSPRFRPPPSRAGEPTLIDLGITEGGFRRLRLTSPAA